MRQVLVELGVLLVLDVLLRALPEGHHRVERLRLALFARLLVLFLLVLRDVKLAEGDRVGDEVGILLHEIGDTPPVEILELVVAEVQRDRSPREVALAVGDRVAARHVGLPLARDFGAALHRLDRHLVGDHERRVEADAELANELGKRLPAFFLQHLAELLRAGRRDGTEVLLELGGVHADAVVGDHQRLRAFVGGDLDLPFRVVLDERLVGERKELRAVYRIRGVGDELAEEYLLLRVERIYHEIEHFGDLGLELFLFHS